MILKFLSKDQSEHLVLEVGNSVSTHNGFIPIRKQMRIDKLIDRTRCVSVSSNLRASVIEV
jgi:hypothetical protein